MGCNAKGEVEMLRKLLLKLGGSFIGAELRAVAEGKRGEFAKKVYWALAGVKTFTGLAFGAAAVALLSLNQNEGAAVLGTLAGILVAGGLVDGRWRSHPDWETAPAWILVRNHAADVFAILGTGAAYFTTCSGSTAALLAHAHLTCGAGIAIVTAATGIFTWLMGEAQLSVPPSKAV